jgi:hypothetical protein
MGTSALATMMPVLALIQRVVCGNTSCTVRRIARLSEAVSRWKGSHCTTRPPERRRRLAKAWYSREYRLTIPEKVGGIGSRVMTS